MSTRRARSLLGALAIGASVLLATPGGAFGHSAVAAVTRDAVRAQSASTALLTLDSQTPWVTPADPWFTLSLGVSAAAGESTRLHLSLSFYSRLSDPSQIQQAIGGTPSTTALLHLPDVPVVPTGTGASVAGAGSGPALSAVTCVTVVPSSGTTPPSSGANVCTAGSPTLTLECTPDTGKCGDVYPVTVSLLRDGATTPLARLTTFLTYQEPTAVSKGGGPLRVGVVLPVTATGAAGEAVALAAHRDVATTLAVSPAGVAAVNAKHPHGALHPYEELAGLSDEIVEQPYVPVNLAALSQAGISGEIGAQLDRGDTLLRSAGLKPGAGLWIDTGSSFSQGDAANLAQGLQIAGARQLVLNDTDLSTAGNRNNYTFAQPFGLDLGHGNTVPALAADSALSARFTGEPASQVLDAEQLLAALSFVHFENPYLSQPRGVVVVPPPGWQPTARFLDAFLGGLTGNPALDPVTVSQLFERVPVSGNDEPGVRRLQSGPAGRGITRVAAARIGGDRQQLASFDDAANDAANDAAQRSPALSALADQLLATEARNLSASRRAGALSAYARSFGTATGQITLATERTVTFTARQAAIPVTVLSAAPYPVKVVVTLTSDKFLFPDGNSRQLVLDRATTSWRFTAQARTSGDRLPIEVTLHTPDGQVLIAHTVLTVHATSISFVGVALTAVAGAVLLAWWVRTWRRSRRQRPRPYPRVP